MSSVLSNLNPKKINFSLRKQLQNKIKQLFKVVLENFIEAIEFTSQSLALVTGHLNFF